MNVRVLRALHRTGGSGAWSDAVSQLAVVLEQEFAGRSVVAMDWGLARNLVVLTDGRLRPTEVYERRPTPSAGAEAACASLLADPTHVYVRHAPPHSAFPGVWERCLRVAGEQHLALRRARLLRTRTGEPVIEIYTAEPE